MRLLGRRRLATGIFLTLEQVHFLSTDHRAVVRDVVRHPGGVGVLAVEGEDVFLVHQHRAPFQTDVAEIPAGKLEPLERHHLEEAAARECREEIGAIPGRLTLLARSYPSPGYTDEVLHLYLAEGLTWVGRAPDGAEEQHLFVERLSLAEALRRIDTGEIADGKTQVALLAWARRLKPTGPSPNAGREQT